MERFNEDCLPRLAAHHDSPSISLYMPTKSWQAAQHATESRTRLRNLSRSAVELLVDRGLRRPDADELLDSLSEQSQDALFWRRAQCGLVAFLSRAESRIFALPEPPPEKVVALDRFYLKPLLSYVGKRGRFYVLAATENSVTFFAGDRDQIAELDVPGLCDDGEKERNVDAPRDVVSVLTTGGAPPGKRAAIIHDHGGALAHRQKNLESYFRRVDQAIAPVLADENAPLIFAGVSYLYPLYRSINRYAYLLGECISGNPDLYSHDELRRRAWALVEPFYARSREMTAARFNNLHRTGRASNDVHDLVWAAKDGLIDSLFVAVDADQWAVVDDVHRRITPAEPNHPGREELLDLIAVRTFRQRGTVFAVKASQVPGGELAAAVYR
jgi:hypothetical protein